MRKLSSAFVPAFFATFALLFLGAMNAQTFAQALSAEAPAMDSVFSALYSSETNKDGVADENAHVSIQLIYSKSGNAAMFVSDEAGKTLSHWVYLARENKTYAVQDEAKRIIVSTIRPLSEEMLAKASLISCSEKNGKKSAQVKVDLSNIEISMRVDESRPLDFNALFAFAHFAEFGILPKGMKGLPVLIQKTSKGSTTTISCIGFTKPTSESHWEMLKAFELPQGYSEIVR